VATDGAERHLPERAAVFGRVADAYERARPDYPPQAVPWLVGPAPRRVLDLGAGTGKLTRALVAAGHDVAAVDPAAAMLDTLRGGLPGVDARKGSAEALPLPDADVDVVVVAQAFHWFDPDRALPEIARVLRPGGRLGLVWNIRDETVQWVADLSAVAGSLDALPADVVESRLAAQEWFGEPEATTFPFVQRLDRNTLLSLVESRSYVAIRPPQERAAIYAEVRRLYERHASPDGLDLPYTTHCYRAHRSS